MRLFEAILDANHRAAAGDTQAGLRPLEFSDSLRIVALSCIDPRLSPLLPEVLGIPEEQFIWVRSAGNVVSGSTSDTLRSIALACATKGGKEIVILGHTDCMVGKSTMMGLIEQFEQMGVRRTSLPQNLTEFFGMFGSERQNVIKGAELVRASPLIGLGIPVHGLLVDTCTGKLEWLVNGYFSPAANLQAAPAASPVETLADATEELGRCLPSLDTGEMKFPEHQIGHLITKVEGWLESIESAAVTSQTEMLRKQQDQPQEPPKIPLPPRIKPRLFVRRSPRG